WLADVGFGDSFIEPLGLDDPDEQVQRGVGYRIEREEDTWRVCQSQPRAEWEPLYAFTLQPHRLEDFSAMCHWQQTAPESHFTQKRMCSMATPDGRVTLSDMKLIFTRNRNRQERAVADDHEFNTLLLKYFGFRLTE
ncbi:MAG: arylamine N-acetyltransferase, partial [Ignavibacteria bacterium]|nr:arylamine N-acetyltransferase [Ignavibacteria bacterium]